MKFPFVTLDVFTTVAFEGNPLAVVRIPVGAELSQEKKQQIAKEFNLSETVFLHENVDATSAEWRVDIFTTEEELPFAGHPTIGAASYILTREQLSSATLQLKAGPTPVTNPLGVPLTAMAKIAHNVHLHQKSLIGAYEGAGLASNEIIRAAEQKSPLFSIVRGMTFLLVRLPSLDVLGQLQSSTTKMDLESRADEEWRTGFFGKYYYVLEEDDTGRDGGGAVGIRSRMMFGGGEDPATGSAASALTAYLTLQGVGNGKFEVVQGVEMGRKSIIGLEICRTADGSGIKSVVLTGTAVQVMEGSLEA